MPAQTVARAVFAHTRENMGDFFGRTSDISACAMSEVKLPVMDPRVPNLRQTKPGVSNCLPKTNTCQLFGIVVLDGLWTISDGKIVILNRKNVIVFVSGLKNCQRKRYHGAFLRPTQNTTVLDPWNFFMNDPGLLLRYDRVSTVYWGQDNIRMP